MNNVTKKQLVTRLREGDKTAFTLIYYEYINKLYFYCFRFVESNEMAEELVQEIFIKLWDLRNSLNPNLSFDAFLYRITKNHTINHIKKKAFENRVKKEIAHRSSYKENETENRILMNETSKLLNSVIERLPEKRQLIYKMRKLEGFDNSEIASKLGISKNTVQAQLVKGSKFVKKHVSYFQEVY